VSDDPFGFDGPCDPPLEIVQVKPTTVGGVPDNYRDRIAVYTAHDGAAIPGEFRVDLAGKPLVDPELLTQRFVEERDWGANLVASELASAMGLASYARTRVARVLLDFNRFPGSTPTHITDSLESLAIGRLYAEILTHGQKTFLLEKYYDRISDLLEEHLANKVLAFAVHTYDEHNPSATKRADVSIISLPLSYQREARMTFGVFDPMYPDRLAESTCSRILRDRISIDLERAGFRVIHNHPYSLPDGCIEVRAQVWFFFRYLREKFQEAFPETRSEQAYELVWLMLLDTNLRLQQAEALRSLLHRFRKVTTEKSDLFSAALEAYRHVRRFMRSSTVVRDYRRWPNRPGSIGIEVRKDLVCTVDPSTDRPTHISPEQRETARQIACAMAAAVKTYVEQDRDTEPGTRH